MNDMTGRNSLVAAADIDEAERYAAVVDEWTAKGIADDLAAGKARDLQARLTQLHKQLDEQRRIEKEPHLSAAKAVDEKYRHALTVYDRCKKSIGTLLTGWLQREQKRLDAERAAAEAEARRLADEARRAAAEAEKSTLAAIQAEQATKAAEDAALRAQRAAQAKPQAESAHGGTRRAALRTTYHAKVTSFGPAVKQYWGRSEIVEVLERLASADARAGKREIPGFEILERSTAA